MPKNDSRKPFSKNVHLLRWGKKWRRCANRIAFTGWMPNYEVLSHEELFIDLKGHLPKELIYEREMLIYRM